MGQQCVGRKLLEVLCSLRLYCVPGRLPGLKRFVVMNRQNSFSFGCLLSVVFVDELLDEIFGSVHPLRPGLFVRLPLLTDSFKPCPQVCDLEVSPGQWTPVLGWLGSRRFDRHTTTSE